MNKDDSNQAEQPIPLRAKKKPGKATGMLAAVLKQDDRLAIAAQPTGGAVEPDEEDEDAALRLAQELRKADPNFTAEKLRARASGAKTVQVPVFAPGVLRQRRARRIAFAGMVSMLLVTIVGVTRLVSGMWIWTLLWQAIQAA